MEKFSLTSFPGPEALAHAAAELWLGEVDAAHRADKPFSVALSGGRIAVPFYNFTTAQAAARHISFEPVHFFWSDERCVPPDNPESNFKTARELLLAPLKVRESHIHRIRGEETPDAAARKAEAEMRHVVPGAANDQAALDLVILGLGPDGHTASLFPAEPEEMMFDNAIYRAVMNSPKPPPERVTLGYRAIAAARQVWMLASGAGKEKALRDSLAPDGKTPFARVLRLRPDVKILSDIAI